MSHIDYREFIYDPKHSKTSQSTLSAEQLHHDLHYLCEALEYAYPAKWAMKSEDWKNLLQSIQTLKFSRPVSCETFGEALAELLWRVPDGHLKVRMEGKTLGKHFKGFLRNPTTKGLVEILFSSESLPTSVRFNNPIDKKSFSFFIGATRANEIIGDLDKTPHLLVAGQTGGGKSTFCVTLLRLSF